MISPNNSNQLLKTILHSYLMLEVNGDRVFLNHMVDSSQIVPQIFYNKNVLIVFYVGKTGELKNLYKFFLHKLLTFSRNSFF